MKVKMLAIGKQKNNVRSHHAVRVKVLNVDVSRKFILKRNQSHYPYGLKGCNFYPFMLIKIWHKFIPSQENYEIAFKQSLYFTLGKIALRFFFL